MARNPHPRPRTQSTPQEVEALDRRRRRGQLFLVLCFQCIIVGTLVTLWAGQDLTYSPLGPPHVHSDAILFTLAATSASPAYAFAAAPRVPQATR